MSSSFVGRLLVRFTLAVAGVALGLAVLAGSAAWGMGTQSAGAQGQTQTRVELYECFTTGAPRIAYIQPDAPNGCTGTLSPGIASVVTVAATGGSAFDFINGSPRFGAILAPSETSATRSVDFRSESATIASLDVRFEAGRTLTYQVISFIPAPPVISGLPSEVLTDEDVPITPVTFTVAAGDPSFTEPIIVTASVGFGTGEVSVTGSGATRTLNFTPAPDYSGRTLITVQASQGDRLATVTLWAVVNAVGDPPVPIPNPITAAIDEDSGRINIPFDSTNPDRVPVVRYDILSNDPAVGPFGVYQDQGQLFISFTPALNFSGTASTTIRLTNVDRDGVAGASADYPIIVTVRPINDPPVANPDALSTDEDQDLTITADQLLDNDSDVDIDDVLTVSEFTPPSSGTLTLAGDGLLFSPEENFSGTVTFTYRVSDGNIESAPATVTITVNAVNDPPVATAVVVSATEDQSATITLAGTDPDSTTLTWAYGQPEHGTVVGTGPEVTYQPDPDYAGPDSFTFTVSDGTLTSAPATVTITVAGVADAPVIDPASVRDLRADATSTAGAVVPFAVPAATDVDIQSGDKATPVTCIAPIGPAGQTVPVPADATPFPIGATVVTCTAEDFRVEGDAGPLPETVQATFTVTVEDVSVGAIEFVGGPARGGIYTTASVPPPPTCRATGFLFPVLQCTVTGYSAQPGRHILTARARDSSGRVIVETRTYTVLGAAATTTPRPVTPTPPATPTVRPTTPVATPTRPVSTPTPVPTVRPTRPAPTPTTPPSPTRPPRR